MDRTQKSKNQMRGDKRSQSKNHESICSPDFLHTSQQHCQILSEQCFPIQMGSMFNEIQTKEVFDEFFCGALTCEKAIRFKKLRQLWNERTTTSVPYNVFVFFIVIFLVVFYVVVCVFYMQQKGQQGDMRHLRNKGWWRFKKKQKLY
eukprot:TRINITY_DN18054_c0_g1_i2.p3 TRINITY_DN18054_c0_g1~~TRINITY_DN18054_c0_g1_i2.p3  ORF type:complete len:147 (+),score=13.77 TRINITY_DN18054_c0_g1_i2:25-465(+)